MSIVPKSFIAPDPMPAPDQLIEIDSAATSGYEAQTVSHDGPAVVGIASRNRLKMRLAGETRNGAIVNAGSLDWYVPPDCGYTFYELPKGFVVWIDTSGNNNDGTIAVWHG
ncbi:MAG: hypothetical protein OXT70_01160 [Chloroflexota bacterium]|nr:hypothetical protein [Chloroflexota bacterium]